MSSTEAGDKATMSSAVEDRQCPQQRQSDNVFSRDGRRLKYPFQQQQSNSILMGGEGRSDNVPGGDEQWSNNTLGRERMWNDNVFVRGWRQGYNVLEEDGRKSATSVIDIRKCFPTCAEGNEDKTFLMPHVVLKDPAGGMSKSKKSSTSR